MDDSQEHSQDQSQDLQQDSQQDSLEYSVVNNVYICKKCGSKFNDKSNIKRHLKRRKPCTTLKKEYRCIHCSKVYYDTHKYKNHLLRKTDCRKDLNAHKSVEVVDYKEKYKKLEEEIEMYKNQLELMTEHKNKQEELMQSWMNILKSDYVDVVVFKREMNITTLFTYMTEVLLKEDELDMHRIKSIYHHILDRIKVEYLNKVIYKVRELSTKNKIFFQELTKEYISMLEKCHNETLHGKLRIHYISVLQKRLLSELEVNST